MTGADRGPGPAGWAIVGAMAGGLTGYLVTWPLGPPLSVLLFGIIGALLAHELEYRLLSARVGAGAPEIRTGRSSPARSDRVTDTSSTAGPNQDGAAAPGAGTAESGREGGELEPDHEQPQTAQRAQSGDAAETPSRTERSAEPEQAEHAEEIAKGSGGTIGSDTEAEDPVSDEPEEGTTSSSTRMYDPPSWFREQANVTDPEIREAFDADWPTCWERAAELLDWEEPYDTVLETHDAPRYEWFGGGRLNACYNCVDRHVERGHGNVAAVTWIGENGETRTDTYRDLYRKVNAVASAFRVMGVTDEDVVTVALPTVPELPVVLLACARLGVPHLVVAPDRSAGTLAARMQETDSTHLVTCDGLHSGGETVNVSERITRATETVDASLTTVVVDRLHGGLSTFLGDTAYDYETLIERHEGETVEPVARAAADPLLLAYTSGRTGHPSGVEHATGGWLAQVAWTAHAVLDLGTEDTHWCTSPAEWLVGQAYGVYGPLALGSMTLLNEGTLDTPHRGRAWELVERHAVDVLYTTPDACRRFERWGDAHPAGHDTSSLRLLGTVGEPISDRTWRWLHEHVGDGDCVIVDTWWQTETGAVLIGTLPGIDGIEPGRTGPPLPGIATSVVGADGTELEVDQPGALVLDRPVPGMCRTVLDDDGLDAYWSERPESTSEEWRYATGDAATIDDDSYLGVLGHLEDMLDFSGHRLAPTAIESAISVVDDVADAAVITTEHDLTGNELEAYVVPETGTVGDDGLRDRIVEHVTATVGPHARPAAVTFVETLPRTPGGALARRPLAAHASGEPLDGIDTLVGVDWLLARTSDAAGGGGVQS